MPCNSDRKGAGIRDGTEESRAEGYTKRVNFLAYRNGSHVKLLYTDGLSTRKLSLNLCCFSFSWTAFATV